MAHHYTSFPCRTPLDGCPASRVLWRVRHPCPGFLPCSPHGRTPSLIVWDTIDGIGRKVDGCWKQDISIAFTCRRLGTSTDSVEKRPPLHILFYGVRIASRLSYCTTSTTPGLRATLLALEDNIHPSAPSKVAIPTDARAALIRLQMAGRSICSTVKWFTRASPSLTADESRA